MRGMWPPENLLRKEKHFDLLQDLKRDVGHLRMRYGNRNTQPEE